MINGCPPKRDEVKDALIKAGIRVPSYFFKNLDKGALLFMQKYQGNPEFEEKFYTML